MLNFRDKETCGIPLLGMFVVELAQQLTKILDADFKVDMEFMVVVDKIKSGQKPAADTAVCAIAMTTNKPVTLKPIVDP